MAKFPIIPDNLITALEEVFPDKAPRSTNVTATEVGELIGMQRVMDFLREKRRRQDPMED